MKSNLSFLIAKQTGVPRQHIDLFLANFSDAILLAADKGVAKTPLFRISKLGNKAYKPNVNPSSRLRNSISLMPLNSELVEIFSAALNLDDCVVAKMLNALMELGKYKLSAEGKFLIPNTVKLEARDNGVIRIVSLQRLKKASARSKTRPTLKSSTVEDLRVTH